MSIKKCSGSCSHPGAPTHTQDRMYGKGIRVHNDSITGAKSKCTVCGPSKYDKLWASSPNPICGVKLITPAEREYLGHCARVD